MMKSFSQKIIFILVLSLVFVPVVSYSVTTVSGIVSECINPEGFGECTFDDVVSAVKVVVNWGTIFVLQFSVVVIAFAGFRYMKSGDNAAERTKANEMLRKVVIGIFFILTAWVIVTLIMNVLVKTGSPGGKDVPLLLK